MNRLRQLTPSKLGIAMFAVVLAVFGSLMGATFASAQSHAAHQAQSSSALPCQFGGDSCIKPGGVRVAGRLGGPGGVSEGAAGDGQRVRLARGGAGRDGSGGGR